MTDDDIKRLKRLAEQATPGPWRVNMKGHSYHEVARVNDLEIAPPNSVELSHWTIDAAYIAAMSPSVTLALLREIGRLRADAARYAYLRDHMLHGVSHPHGSAIGMSEVLFGDDPDEAIDAAMKEQEK